MLVKIPVSPLVKKLILKDEVEEPILLRMGGLLGLAMLSVVGRRKIKKVIKYLDIYTEHLEINIPDSIGRYSHNPVRLSIINDLFYQKFKHEMFLFIKAQKMAGVVKTKEAILNFLQMYDIKEHEYSPDTARREWNRHKEKEVEKAQKKQK